MVDKWELPDTWRRHAEEHADCSEMRTPQSRREAWALGEAARGDVAFPASPQQRLVDNAAHALRCPDHWVGA